MTLTAKQQLAVKVLKACDDYADGWGLMMTEAGSTAVDGQAWINHYTAHNLARKGVAELDVQFGRVRLLDR